MHTDSISVLKKTVLYGAALVALLSVVIYFVTNYSLLYVSVDKPAEVRDVRVYLYYNGEENNIGNPGLHVIKRGVDQEFSIVSGENIRTLAQINIPWYGFTYKKVRLDYDKNAEKIAYKSTLDSSCGTYSENLETLLQYRCTKPSRLLQLNTPIDKEWTMDSIHSNMYFLFSPPTPYMGGLLGIDYSLHHPTVIVAARDDGSVTTFDPPKGYQQDTFSQAKIFADTHAPKSNRFIITEPSGKIHMASPVSDKLPEINYKSINPPDDYIPGNSHTICDLYDARVVCYTGQKDYPIGKVTSKPTKASITTLSFENDTTQTLALPDNFVLQDFRLTENGEMFGVNNGVLFYIKQDTGKATPVRVSDKITGISTTDKLYAIHDQGVFTVDTQKLEMHQVFYSTNIAPEKLVGSGRAVFVIGKSYFDKKSTYAWRLNNQQDTDHGQRSIDRLPFMPISSTYGTADLVEDKLYITVPALNSSSADDIKQMQKNTLKYLRDNGFDLDKFTIVYAQ